MKQILLTLAILFGLGGIPAYAQGCGESNPNCIVPTAPPGSNNNQAASTAFVQNAVEGATGGSPGGANTDVQFNNSGAFGGDSGFTYLGLGQATLSLGTIATAKTALTITSTWNNSGVNFPPNLQLECGNASGGSSGGTSSCFDVTFGGADVFGVYPEIGGGVFIGPNRSVLTYMGNSSNNIAFATSGGVQFLVSGTPTGLNTNSGWNFTGVLGISGGVSSPNGLLNAPALNTFSFGGIPSGVPASQTIQVQNASGTNIPAAPALTIIGPLSSGTATDGDIIFQVGVKNGSSGTGEATPTTALTLKDESLEVIANGPFVAAAAAAAVTSGQISYGSTTAAVSNCGAAATACIVINVGGTTRYIPYY